MKICPNCNDLALYDDNVERCPLCGRPLIPYQNARLRETENGPIVQPTNITTARQRAHNSSNNVAPPFETREGSRYIFRGAVTEITSSPRLHNRFKKILNSLFHSEPYQFGDTSHQTILRIEEFSQTGFASQKRDVIIYGDVEGRFVHGDDVTITAKRSGNRYIATRIRQNETESYVTPSIQIPSIVVKIIAGIILLTTLLLLIGIIEFITTGAFLGFLSTAFDGIISIALKLLVVALPIIAAIYLIRIIITGHR